MQVTAAAFIAQGNMLVVSDRGDRLLLLNYHGLHPAKRCVLPWNQPARPVLPRQDSEGNLLDGIDPNLQELQEAHPPAGEVGGAVAGGLAASSSGASGGGYGSRVLAVTSIVECPDVVGRCSDEWRSGISQLAVSSSRGDVILIKI